MTSNRAESSPPREGACALKEMTCAPIPRQYCWESRKRGSDGFATQAIEQRTTPRRGDRESFSPNPASGSPTMTVGTSPATSAGSCPLTTG